MRLSLSVSLSCSFCLNDENNSKINTLETGFRFCSAPTERIDKTSHPSVLPGHKQTAVPSYSGAVGGVWECLGAARRSPHPSLTFCARNN